MAAAKTPTPLTADLLRAMVEDGFTHQQIAETFGHITSHISGACVVLGIRSRFRGFASDHPMRRKTSSNEFLGSRS